MTVEALRLLPAVETVASALRADGIPAALASALSREAIDAARAELAGRPRHADREALKQAIVAHARASAAALAREPLPAVINATGTILHTGLGRAPLSERARQALARVARGYCQLELDLATGERGDRQDHVEPLLRRLLGAEAALVVNNCAGAVVLALQALAQGREVIVSRGELVEIGGSFRVPEIMAAAGCRLVEVGSTNKTRIEDYERAVTSETAVLLKVHKSNFVQEGFVAEVAVDALVALGERRGLPVLVDQGSGGVVDLAAVGVEAKRVGEDLAAGAALLACSGDKLLGGPQAGILVGKRDLVARCKRHPLARAVRADKLQLAALAGTLQDYLLDDPVDSVPTLAALTEPSAAVKARAEALLAAIAGVDASVEEGQGAVGSGAAPTQGPATWLVALRGGATRLARALRVRRVVARVARDAVLIDLRTVAPDEVAPLAAAIVAAVDEAARG
jgi:L-seryl-tRNA(Ser) seleniumtransferase